MTEVALLNPPVEAAVCRKMIGAVKDEQEKINKALTGSILPQDKYHQTIGVSLALARLVDLLERMYDREFNT